MIQLIVILWLEVGVLSFLLLCRTDLEDCGRLTRGDVAFNILMSMFGPPSLFAAMVIRLLAQPQAEFWSVQIWPKRRAT